MEVLTPKMMSKCDQDTINAGYPEILLMEAAALGTAKYAEYIIKNNFNEEATQIRITVLVGKGNNGGDGLAAARILKNWGYNPKIILASTEAELKNVNKKNFNLAVLNKIDHFDFTDLNEKKFLNIIKNSDLIIDGLLGTGIKGDLRGNIKKIIALINSRRVDRFSTKPIILSVDIPSGVNGKTGEIAGEAISADYTATMASYKRGLLLYPGRDYTGEIKVINIGIQEETLRKNGDGLKLFDQKKATELIPNRKNYGHKGDFAKIAILAGSRGMTGAPLLSSEAALRSGAGLVYLLTAEEIEAVTTAQLKELVGIPLHSNQGIISKKALTKILSFSNKVDLMALGPGLGTNDDLKFIVKKILEKSKISLVLDADALNSIDDLQLIKNYAGELIITPHPGEMSRLTGLDVNEINKNRIKVAREFAANYNVNIILKGAATIIASPDGRTYINRSGCNGMATAGSGDVLTGITATLAAQINDKFEAAALAAYIHGKAGEFAAVKLSNFALKAGDIIENLSEFWNEI